MGTIVVPFRDVNAQNKEYMMMLAQMLGTQRKEQKQVGQMKELAMALDPDPTSTINGENLFSDQGFDALRSNVLDGTPATFGQQAGQPLTWEQEMSKVLSSGLPIEQAMSIARSMPKAMTPLQKSQIKANEALANWRKNRPPEGAQKPLTRSNISTAKRSALKILKDVPTVFAHQFGRKNYSQANLTEAYKEFRIEQVYDILSEKAKQRLDKVWDSLIAVRNKTIEGGNEYDWAPESAEVKDLRAATTGTSTKDPPPHQALAPFWEGIDQEERQEITDELQVNPNSITEILRILGSG